MKRDMDAIRKLLLDVEAGTGRPLEVKSNSPESAQLLLLLDAGFITSIHGEAMPRKYTSAEVWMPRLTWAGAEFLDVIRKDGHWKRIRETLRLGGFQPTVEAIRAFHSEGLRRFIGSPGLSASPLAGPRPPAPGP